MQRISDDLDLTEWIAGGIRDLEKFLEKRAAFAAYLENQAAFAAYYLTSVACEGKEEE